MIILNNLASKHVMTISTYVMVILKHVMTVIKHVMAVTKYLNNNQQIYKIIITKDKY